MDAEQRFGILVRNAMDARGVKGYQLAAAMNKQPSYVSRIINGEYKGTPPAVEMIVIEEVLGLPIWKQLQALEYPVGPDASTMIPDDVRLLDVIMTWEVLTDSEKSLITQALQVGAERRGQPEQSERLLELAR